MDDERRLSVHDVTSQRRAVAVLYRAARTRPGTAFHRARPIHAALRHLEVTGQCHQDAVVPGCVIAQMAHAGDRHRWRVRSAGKTAGKTQICVLFKARSHCAGSAARRFLLTAGIKRQSGAMVKYRTVPTRHWPHCQSFGAAQLCSARSRDRSDVLMKEKYP